MKSFKYCSLIIITILLSTNILAQNSISGKVNDSRNNPIVSALVWLTQNNKTLSYTTTDISGNFNLDCNAKNIILHISCLGYKNYESEAFNSEYKKDFKVIVLQDDNTVINDAIIIGEKLHPIIEQKPGKMVFNVENSINATGGTGLDVLKLAPGVAINQDSKKISISGQNNISIMLNGKKMYMEESDVIDLLRSMNSANIKSIEIINNGTAKYEASGTGGILNIVLKKNASEGYNLSFNSGVGYWKHLRNNTELSFNYNHNRINLYANYSHNIGHYGLNYGGIREQDGNLIESNSKDTDKRNTYSSSFGIDYKINDKQTIGANIGINALIGPGVIYTNNDIYNDYNRTQLLYSIYSIANYEKQNTKRFNYNLNYRYDIDDSNSLDIDLDYSHFNSDQISSQPNYYYSRQHSLDSTIAYKLEGNRLINLYGINADYKGELGQGILNTGIKFTNVRTENDYYLNDITNGNEVLDLNHSNNFDYKESILAGFIMYDINVKKLAINMGLRGEYTFTNGELIPVKNSKIQPNNVKRDYFDLFPSLNLTYNIKERQSLSFGYGRRIDRPIYSDLNPIEQPLDGLSIWKGNPFLKPQKSHKLSLKYQNNNTIVELSYNRTNDYRGTITDTLNHKNLIIIPLNLGKLNYYGLNIYQSLKLFHKVDINFNGSLYYTDNKMAFDRLRFYHKQRLAYQVSMQSSFPICYGIKSEILCQYFSKRLGESTETLKASGFVDIGFQKTFFDQKLSLKLAVTDIFHTNKWDNINSFGDFRSVNYGYGESRQIKFNISMRFGGNKNHYQKDSKIDEEVNRF